MKQLTKEQRDIRRRILEISFKLKLSHLGSCFSAVDLIDSVYKHKKKSEKFVLSSGHAGIALYAVLEKYGFIKDPKTFEKLYIHPDRNLSLDIHVSTGSLGQGLPIALGMAIATKERDVYCLISDGEATEGSIWESLRIAVDSNISNLKILLNANGWGAYDSISINTLKRRLKAYGCTFIEVEGHDTEQIKRALEKNSGTKPLMIFAKTSVNQFPFLKDQDAHYYVMTDQDYLSALDLLLWS